MGSPARGCFRRSIMLPTRPTHTGEGETVSITTGIPQTLYLDEKDRHKITGRRVVLLDDVVSTGSTLVGMRALMAKAGAIIAAEAAGFTEGDPEKWKSIVALGHLPLFGPA